MCYFNSLVAPKGATITLSGTTKQLDPTNRPLQSGFSYHNWPIVKGSTENFTIENAHWELIAPWVKTTQEVQAGREKFNTLNATAERLFESKLFKPAALNNRCLVLSSGFFEWRHYKPAGAKKEIAYPYFIWLGFFNPGPTKKPVKPWILFQLLPQRQTHLWNKFTTRKKECQPF